MKSVLAVILLCSFIFADALKPLVKTPLGKIKGYHKLSFNGRQYRAFEGIPYALPPIGKLRFQPPVAVKKWPGTLLATRPQSICLQYDHLPINPPERVEGSEDCLYLNIYTPAVEGTKKLLPVLFYIHGGAFQYGSGYYTGPEYIMDRDVIFVNFNYRLGPFGKILKFMPVN